MQILLFWLYQISQALRFPLLVISLYSLLRLITYALGLNGGQGILIIGTYLVMLIAPALLVSLIIYRLLKKKFKYREIKFFTYELTFVATGLALIWTAVHFIQLRRVFAPFSEIGFLSGILSLFVSWTPPIMIGFLLIMTFPPLSTWLLEQNRSKVSIYGISVLAMIGAIFILSGPIETAINWVLS